MVPSMQLVLHEYLLHKCTKPPIGFPGGSVVMNLPANAGDMGSIPGWGRSAGARNGNPLQYTCLRNPMDRGAWRTPLHGVAKESDMTCYVTETQYFLLINNCRKLILNAKETYNLEERTTEYTCKCKYRSTILAML